MRESFVKALANASRPACIKEGTPYLLYVGRIDPKKNIRNLILGFDTWNRVRGFTHQLVVCGRKDPYYHEIDCLIRERNIQNVIVTGWVCEQELANLYANASLVVLPTCGEGIGLPIVEGLAAGKRVLVSDTAKGVSEQLKERLVFCSSEAGGIAAGFERAMNSLPPNPFEWNSFSHVAKKIYHGIMQ